MNYDIIIKRALRILLLNLNFIDNINLVMIRRNVKETYLSGTLF